MNKKMCFLIFVAAIITIIAGFLLNIGIIKSITKEILADMQGFYVCAAGVAIGLLLYKHKYYWLLLIGCAIIAAVLIHLLVLGGLGSVHALAIRAVAVMAYGYLTALIRFMIA